MVRRVNGYKPFPIHDYVVDSLNELNRTDDLVRVQEDTGISRWWLMKTAIRSNPNPGIKRIEILYHYFKAREGKDLRQRHSSS